MSVQPLALHISATFPVLLEELISEKFQCSKIHFTNPNQYNYFSELCSVLMWLPIQAWLGQHQEKKASNCIRRNPESHPGAAQIAG